MAVLLVLRRVPPAWRKPLHAPPRQNGLLDWFHDSVVLELLFPPRLFAMLFALALTLLIALVNGEELLN